MPVNSLKISSFKSAAWRRVAVESRRADAASGRLRTVRRSCTPKWRTISVHNVRDKARSLPARLIAIMAARIAELTEPPQDLVQTALDDADATKVRVVAAVTLQMIGDASSRAALKQLLAAPPEQADMEIWLLQKAARDADDPSEFATQKTGPMGRLAGFFRRSAGRLCAT
jgi:hypothetical protein